MGDGRVNADGLVDAGEMPEDPILYNPDLEPTGPGERSWTKWNLAALWVGMSVCIPTFLLAGSLIKMGMNWWQATLTVFLGNLIVLVPLVLNGHAGTKYGIPFPVFARASFGVFGAHVPSIARALVASGWFGIQCFVGGEAILQMVKAVWPGFAAMGGEFTFLWLDIPEPDPPVPVDDDRGQRHGAGTLPRPSAGGVRPGTARGGRARSGWRGPTRGRGRP